MSLLGAMCRGRLHRRCRPAAARRDGPGLRRHTRSVHAGYFPAVLHPRQQPATAPGTPRFPGPSRGAGRGGHRRRVTAAGPAHSRQRHGGQPVREVSRPLALGSGPDAGEAAVHLLCQLVGAPGADREQAEDRVGRGGTGRKARTGPSTPTGSTARWALIAHGSSPRPTYPPPTTYWTSAAGRPAHDEPGGPERGQAVSWLPGTGRGPDSSSPGPSLMARQANGPPNGPTGP